MNGILNGRSGAICATVRSCKNCYRGLRTWLQLSRAAASAASNHAILRTGGDDVADGFDSPVKFGGGKLKCCRREFGIATWNVEGLGIEVD